MLERGARLARTRLAPGGGGGIGFDFDEHQRHPDVLEVRWALHASECR